jgi:2-dehydro-3-deoxyphosphooctonate aldolase (KDO 8-P synthase)
LLEEVAQVDAQGLALLRDAADQMHLSARGYHRVLRVARTLADLDAAAKVGRIHPAEALSYRALTDVHEYTPLDEVTSVVDVLQTPAFLCRQTDFIHKVASAGKPVNIKKGQFLSPWEMKHVTNKAKATGNEQIMACERGASFGYNNLVSDMRSLSVMRDTGCPVVFDATHSVQLPGGMDGKSGGQREFVPVLARAAMAVGIAGIFMETHPKPEEALSDGPNAWPLGKMEALLETLMALDSITKKNGFLETEV